MSTKYGCFFIIPLFFISLSLGIFSFTYGIDSLFGCFQDVFGIDDFEDLEDIEEENAEENNRKFKFHKKIARLIKKSILKLKKLFQCISHKKIVKFCVSKILSFICIAFYLCIIALSRCNILHYPYYLQESKMVILKYIHNQDGEK